MVAEIKQVAAGKYAVDFDEHSKIEISDVDADGGRKKPKFSIEKWNRECYVEITPKNSVSTGLAKKENAGAGPKIIEEISTGDAVDDETHVCYSLEADFQMELGGFEIEAVLKFRPAGDQVEFVLNCSPNIEFLYQAPYDEQAPSPEDAAVVTRTATHGYDKDGKTIVEMPENVVGSFALYRANTAVLQPKGSPYKTGKIGHIYRPRIIDADLNSVWGILKINNGNKKLTIDIPSEFLDTAVYPIIVDPTFGYTTAGASSGSLGGVLVGISEASIKDGEITKLTAHLDEGSATPTKMALYNSSDDLQSPQTEEKNITASNEWIDFDVVEGTLTVTDAAEYTIAAWADAGAGISISRDSGTSGDSKYSIESYGAWPASVSFSNSSYKYSTYATYAPVYDLAATADGQATAAGTLEADAPLTATADGVTTAAADLEVAAPLTGTVDATADAGMHIYAPGEIREVYPGHYHLDFDTQTRVTIREGALGGGRYRPIYKFVKWGEECCLEIRPFNTCTTGMSEEVEGEDIVKLHSGDVSDDETHSCYMLDADSQMELGGFEVEAILKSRPAADKVMFNLSCTENIEFFYQPPIDEENQYDARIVTRTETQGLDSESNVIVERPENVVGSYAVYRTNTSGIQDPASVYKKGKIGHIYRPKITDDSLNETWGTITINPGKTLITIDIPSAFLDAATYPIIVDPTFGYTTLGSSASLLDDTVRCHETVAPQNGEVVKLTMGLNSNWDSGEDVKMAMYTDGESLMSPQTEEKSTGHASTDWVDFNVSGGSITVTNATTYLITGWAEVHTSVQYDSGSFGDGRFEPVVFYGPTWPSTISTFDDPRLYSMYATLIDIRDFTGTVDGQATVDADVVGILDIEGTVDGVAGADADLEVVVPVTGTVDGQTAVDAAGMSLSTTGTVDGQATADGDLEVVAPITGTTDGQATADAQLEVVAPLTGTVDGQTTVDADIGVGLVGTVDGQAAADGILKVDVPLTGTVDGQATVDGQLEAVTPVDGTVDGVATVDGTLEADAPLTGIVDGQATVDGTLGADAPLTGTADGVATVDGSVSLGLTAAVDGQAVVGGSVSVGLTATTDAQATADASLEVDSPLTGAVDGQTTVDADIGVGLSGTVTAQSTVDADIGGIFPFSATVDGVATADGTLEADAPLTGTIDGVTTADGDLEVVVPITGTVDGVATADGDLEVDAPLTATADGVTTVDADIGVGLTGTVDGVAGADAQLEVVAPVDGMTDGQTTADAQLEVVAPVDGTVDGQAGVDADISLGLTAATDGQTTADGQLEVVAPVDGTVDGQAGVDGDLGVALTGTADGAATVDGTLAPLVDILGTVDGVATADGTLEADAPLTGTADGQATVDGTLEADAPLTATADGVATVDADIGVGLTGTADGVATVDADIGVGLTGTADGVATVDGTLETDAPLTGTVDGQATVDGTLEADAPLSGTVDGVATVDASIAQAMTGTVDGAATVGADIALGITGTVDGQTTADGDLEVVAPVDGTINGQATADGQLEVVAPVTATVDGQAGVDGTLEADAPLTGTVDGVAGADGTLEVIALVTATVDGQTTVEGTLQTRSPLSGTVDGQTTVGADLMADAPLTATVDGQATVGADLNVGSPLTGTVDGQATADGILGLRLAATTDGMATVDGDIGVGLTGGVDGQATADASLKVDAPLAGPIGAQSDTSAELRVEAFLSGQTNALTTADAELIAEILLSGDLDAQSTVDGTLGFGTVANLTGTVDGQSTTRSRIVSQLTEAVPTTQGRYDFLKTVLARKKYQYWLIQATIDKLSSQDINTYRLDTGEGSQLAKRVTIQALMNQSDILFSRIDHLERRLTRSTIVTMQVRRL